MLTATEYTLLWRAALCCASAHKPLPARKAAVSHRNSEVVFSRKLYCATPVPESGTVCVPELVVSVIAADRGPVPCGANTTFTVQLLPAAMLVPQLFVCGKLLGLVPVVLMLVTETVTVLEFFTVIGIAALCVYTT